MIKFLLNIIFIANIALAVANTSYRVEDKTWPHHHHGSLTLPCCFLGCVLARSSVIFSCDVASASMWERTCSVSISNRKDLRSENTPKSESFGAPMWRQELGWWATRCTPPLCTVICRRMFQADADPKWLARLHSSRSTCMNAPTPPPEEKEIPNTLGHKHFRQMIQSVSRTFYRQIFMLNGFCHCPFLGRRTRKVAGEGATL